MTSSRNILITGATGLVGRQLCEKLVAEGHHVYAVLRPTSNAKKLIADVRPLYMDVYHFTAVDVNRLDAIGKIHGVIHLAGDSVFGLWTAEKRKRIYDSRVLYTRQLAELLCALEHPPEVFISASAIGIYGMHNHDLPLAEEAPHAKDFLAKVCQDWEKASELLSNAGVRTVQARFGVILGRQGGAFQAMLPAFKLGLGGKLGDGTQWMSWVHIQDVLGALCFALEHSDLQGVMNVVSPEPVTNETFTKTLGRVLKRPTPFPVPAIALKALLGMGESLLLASQRCVPEVLETHGYLFQFPTLETALSDLIH